MPRGYLHNQPTQRAYPPASRPASTQSPSISFPLSSGSGIDQTAWTTSNSNAHLTSHPLNRFQELQIHKRHSSDSTATSAGPESPFTPVTTAPYIVDAESQAYLPQQFENFDQHGQTVVTSFPKALSESNPQFSDSAFFSPQFQNFSPQYADNHALWEHAMKQAMTQQQHQQQHQVQRQSRQRHGIPNCGYGMSQSQGSSGDFSSGSGDVHGLANGHSRMANRLVPHLDRTVSDACQDELYNPEEGMEAASSSKPSAPTVQVGGSMVSPSNSVFSERLLEASQGHISARSASPTAGVSREKSPFRPYLGLSGESYPHSASPVSRLSSAAQIREHQKAQAEAIAMARHNSPRAVVNEKTVSPKEVSLEYEPDDDASNPPLISDLHSPTRSNARSQQPSKLKQELTRPDQDEYDATSQQSSSNNSHGSGTLQQSNAARIPQQYPFVRQPQHQANRNARRSQESVPVFPAPLPSMESTMESMEIEAASESPKSTSDRSSSADSEVQRPARTNADTGTYTCTYHGCTQRFETPAKLQKHKRDGHRHGTPQSATTSDKDTQAGPHKCERINPTTGKPCNSIFSRPYDLTRHEDTIHNAKKQKVRCHLCVEEKTFSRNDALTRHMRVVHPEVDFPGKLSKRKVAQG